MDTINMLANSIQQRVEDVGRQISQLLMEVNAVMARMNTTSDNYRRLAVEFDAPLVWNGGLVIPQTFEEHQRSRRFFDLLSKAAFVLSIGYLLVGIYFSFTDDPYYLFLVLVVGLLLAGLWHYIIRSVAFRAFNLKPERPAEARVGLAEIMAVGLAIVGFVGALIFAIGRTTGGIAHAVADYYKWSDEHCDSYEADRKLLFRLKEQVSKLTALLSHDLKQFEQIDESERPPVTIPTEVVKVLAEYEKQRDEDTDADDSRSTAAGRKTKPLLAESKDGQDTDENNNN